MSETERPMIETVAKAIYAKYEDRPLYAQLQMNGVLANELASAAIEAMREPTPKMIATTLPMPGLHADPKTMTLAEEAVFFLEGPDFPESAHRNGIDAARQLISDWYSMIDAALQEPGT